MAPDTILEGSSANPPIIPSLQPGKGTNQL
jgi:hypothetical protein